MKKQILAITLLLLCLVSLSACQTAVPYHRTLPDWVRRVYVPVAENSTTDAGLEMLVTNAFINAALEDGRLEIVSKSKADAVVKIRLDKAEKNSHAFSSDDVEATRELILTYSINLYDPADMEKPFGYINKSEITSIYSSDRRALGSIPNVQGRAEWATAAGKKMLSDVLFRLKTGAPGEAKEPSKKKKK